MASVSVLSTEYVKVAVEYTVGGVLTDPTGDIVQMAFVKPGVDPVSLDWQTSSWEVDSTTPSKPIRYARCLIGPAGVKAYTKGSYIVWVKVADNPETPARPAGLLSVE